MMREMPQLRITISSSEGGNSSACTVSYDKQPHLFTKMNENIFRMIATHLQLRQCIVAQVQLCERGKLHGEIMRLW
jgi:hypothetical protein